VLRHAINCPTGTMAAGDTSQPPTEVSPAVSTMESDTSNNPPTGNHGGRGKRGGRDRGDDKRKRKHTGFGSAK
jgi:hypothetical protein